MVRVRWKGGSVGGCALLLRSGGGVRGWLVTQASGTAAKGEEEKGARRLGSPITERSGAGSAAGRAARGGRRES
jgi:hypothetical protein